jgi:hypothetical protein
MKNQLPETIASQAQLDEIKANIIRRYPDYSPELINAVMIGTLSVAVSKESADRLIEIQQM